MPNIQSAKKRQLQSEKRRLRNRTKLIATRNLVKKMKKLTSKEEALKLIPRMSSMFDRLAKHGIIHKNNAANRKSKLTRWANALKG